MLAAVQTRFGGPDVLTLQEVATPAPGAGEVLVRVHASPVTQGDRRLRAADYPGLSAVIGRLMFGVFRPRNPTPGTMFAGVVVAVGPEVTRFAVGDRVFGNAGTGAHAEFVRLAEDAEIASMPDGTSFDEMAALPYGAGTSLYFLRDVAAVQPGESVLILGASGGVGQFAVQIAKHLGATVTGVASGPKLDAVRRLGADHVIDYRVEDFARNGKRYDVIFDVADATSFARSRGSLTERGRYVTLYISLRVLAQAMWTSVFGTQKAKFSVAMGSAESTRQLADLAERGVVRPVIDARFPLSEVTAAHAAAESPQTTGVVMVVGEASAAAQQPRHAATA